MTKKTTLKKRVQTLEEVMIELAKEVNKTTRSVNKLSKEMAEFKKEMAEFKKEMTDFKNEMTDFKIEQEKEHKRMNREWSNLAKKMGTIVEDLIAPALGPVLGKYFNCQLNLEGQRMRRRVNGEEYEIDAIAVCDDKVFMIEVKSTPRQTDIADILDKASRFYYFFPEYRSFELIKIYGSITFDEAVISQASKHGIYVLGWREWEYMDLLNFSEVCKLQS